jgi:peptidyl-prolyl cis-trans isomerase B (cyclophilin B)
VPTNEERRAAAKRKLEQQLQRQEQRARRQRLITIAGSVVAVVVAVAVVAYLVFANRDSEPTETAGPAASTAKAVEIEGVPEYVAPPDLGANCQYPATAEKAAKPVNPPRSGKVPTEPALVSASMSTNQGNIGLMLDNGKAPCTVNNFASLSSQAYFDNTKCHRLTTAPELSVLQCGDPTGTGAGGPGYQFGNEYPTNQYKPGDPKLGERVTYPRGTVAMAHSPGQHNNGSQFFLVYRDSQLPPDYTAFGTIDETGLATLDKIAAEGVAGGGFDGKPNLDVEITSIRLD